MEKYFEQDLAACAWTPNRDGYAAKLLVFVTITKSHWSQRIILNRLHRLPLGLALSMLTQPPEIRSKVTTRMGFVILQRRLTNAFVSPFTSGYKTPPTIAQAHLFDRQAFEKPTTHLKSRRSSCQLHVCR
ncbi:ATP synthase subunit e [Fusarium oxysporum f. sp. albedinis]|nr:ATP synthase subunit e [Fusarium oxysporum f. sp. albedinis]